MAEEAFVHSDVVKLSSGKEIILPPLTLRKILAVTKSVAKLVTVAKEHLPKELFDGSISSMGGVVEIMKALPLVLPHVIEELAETLSIYLGIKKDELLDSFTTEDLVATATPFFRIILQAGNGVVNQFNTMFPSVPLPVVVQNQSEETLKDNSQT